MVHEEPIDHYHGYYRSLAIAIDINPSLMHRAGAHSFLVFLCDE
jgi:hypothetical protein